jgi:hypothetical protein
MSAPANDPVTLTVTVFKNERGIPSILVANTKCPKGTWIARGLIIDMTREAEGGTAYLTIARKLAETRGLV